MCHIHCFEYVLHIPFDKSIKKYAFFQGVIEILAQELFLYGAFGAFTQRTLLSTDTPPPPLFRKDCKLGWGEKDFCL